MNIRSISRDDIPDLILEEGGRNRVLFPNKPKARYFGGFVDDGLVCVICLVMYKNGNATIKSNYTLEPHRGKGYFTALNRYCLNFARQQGVKRITLNCLADSVGVHRKAGARVWKETKTIYWMIYDEGTF